MASSVHLILILACLKFSNGITNNSKSLVFQFFAIKNVQSVDALMCSMEDNKELFEYFIGSARSDGYWGLWRSVYSLNLSNIDEDVKWGLLIDFSCPENQNLLLQTTNEEWFTNNFCWLILDPDDLLAGSGVHERLPLSTFSDVHVGSRRGVWRLYRHRRELPLIFRKVGNWSPCSKDFVFDRRDIEINFQKSIVKGAIMFIEDVFNRSILQTQLIDDQFKPKSDVSNRFIYGNTMHLAYLYNFTLELKVSSIWGDRADNGNWSGMIGLVQRKEVDIALSPLLPLPMRMEVSYPSVPVLPYWMAVIFKQPRALGTYRAMILELSPSSWACVGLLTVLGAILITTTLKRESEIVSNDSSLVMGVLQSVGIITTQGLSLVPNNGSSRIVCLSLLIFGLIVTTYYSAATMTALLSESPPFVKSLEQLISSRIPLSAVDAPYIRNKPIRRRVFRPIVVDKMNTRLYVCGLEEGIQTVTNGSAFLGEWFVLFQAVNDNLEGDAICDLTIFNAGFYQNSVSFMKKCPHFRELHMRGLLRTLEHGLMPKERDKWIAPRPVCSRVTQFIHVRLDAVSVAFGVFFIGVISATGFYIMEEIWSRTAMKIVRK